VSGKYVTNVFGKPIFIIAIISNNNEHSCIMCR